MTKTTYLTFIVGGIFLSHNWGAGSSNHFKVSIINERLKDREYITWFDGDKMFGNTTIAMANGIERSRLALVFITREYMNKINGKGPRGPNDACFLEFRYALIVIDY